MYVHVYVCVSRVYGTGRFKRHTYTRIHVYCEDHTHTHAPTVRAPKFTASTAYRRVWLTATYREGEKACDARASERDGEILPPPEAARRMRLAMGRRYTRRPHRPDQFLRVAARIINLFPWQPAATRTIGWPASPIRASPPLCRSDGKLRREDTVRRS